MRGWKRAEREAVQATVSAMVTVTAFQTRERKRGQVRAAEEPGLSKPAVQARSMRMVIVVRVPGSDSCHPTMRMRSCQWRAEGWSEPETPSAPFSRASGMAPRRRPQCAITIVVMATIQRPGGWKRRAAAHRVLPLSQRQAGRLRGQGKGTPLLLASLAWRWGRWGGQLWRWQRRQWWRWQRRAARLLSLSLAARAGRE